MHPRLFRRQYSLWRLILIFGLLTTIPGQAEMAQNRGIGASTNSGNSGNSAANRRLALVIGNGKYEQQYLSLPNPENDATDMADELRRLGFEVTIATNVNKPQMEDHFRKFGQQLASARAALFYYAGHGTQVDGENYLAPVEATIASEAEIKSQAVNLRQLLQYLQQPGQRLNLVILDACRNNPFRSLRPPTRDIANPLVKAPQSSGLARIDISRLRNTLIAYSTQTDSVASDGVGRNGLYTQELLAAIRTPGWAVEKVFKHVREQVIKKSNGLQTPWENSSLIGDFYFAPGAAPPGNDLAGNTGSDSQPSTAAPAREAERWVVVADRNITIAANETWKQTPIQVQKGQHVRLKVDGAQINLGARGPAGPAGVDKSDPHKPVRDCATGAIVARIGQELICVETGRAFIATGSGALWLGLNESNVVDNRGSLIVKVVVQELRR